MKVYKLHMLIAPLLYAIVVPASSGAAEKKHFARCASFPQGDAQPIVALCENSSRLFFTRGEEKNSYAKAEVEKDLQALVASWLEGTSFPVESLCGSEASLWLSVPESNPSGAQLRLLVKNEHMPFVAFLPWDFKSWLVDQSNTAIIPEKDYPDSFGFRVTSLLVKKLPGVSQEDLQTYLARFGLHSPSPFARSWVAYQSEPFKELDALAELNADSHFSNYLEDATLNPVIEWIASRIKAYSFKWSCPTLRSLDESKEKDSANSDL